MKNLFYLVIVIMGLLFVSCDNDSSNGSSGTAWSSRTGSYTGIIYVDGARKATTLKIEATSGGAGKAVFAIPSLGLNSTSVWLTKTAMDSTEPLVTNQRMDAGTVTIKIIGSLHTNLKVELTGAVTGSGTLPKTYESST